VRNGRCLKSRAHGGTLGAGQAGEGQVDCRESEQGGIAVCIPDQLQLLFAIQRRAFPASGQRSQEAVKDA
jgi:hypothetical protein